MQNEGPIVRADASWAIANAASGGTPAQIAHLVHHGALPAICDQFHLKDPSAIAAVLRAIECVLWAGNAETLASGS